MEEEGKDEEDFQSPIKLGVKSVDLNDANCKNYQKLLKNDKKNIFLKICNVLLIIWTNFWKNGKTWAQKRKYQWPISPLKTIPKQQKTNNNPNL